MSITETPDRTRDYQFWAAEDDQRLIELRSSNTSYAQIAAAMGRTEMSCNSRMRKLGILIRTSPWNDEIEADVKTLWVDHTAAEIAIILNKKHGTQFGKGHVMGKVTRLGLTSADKIVCHAHDSYAPQGIRSQVVRERSPRKKRINVPRKPRLKIVSAGNGALRIQETVTAGALPKLRCVDVQPLNISLANLPDNGCRYIAGDDLLYCGHPQKEKSSYCPAHHALVWVPPLPPKQHAMRRDAA